MEGLFNLLNYVIYFVFQFAPYIIVPLIIAVIIIIIIRNIKNIGKSIIEFINFLLSLIPEKRRTNPTRQYIELPKETEKEKGNYAEQRISQMLGKTDRWNFYKIDNLILSYGKNKSAQIDHIYINSEAVYVIETKYLAGRIYGNDYKKEWTQVLAYGNVKYKFYNPILQNEKHIKKLKEITGTKLPIKSMIIFFDSETDYIKSKNVYTEDEMIEKLKYSIGEPKISPEEMENFYNQLQELKANQIPDEEHIRNVERNRKYQ